MSNSVLFSKFKFTRGSLWGGGRERESTRSGERNGARKWEKRVGADGGVGEARGWGQTLTPRPLVPEHEPQDVSLARSPKLARRLLHVAGVGGFAFRVREDRGLINPQFFKHSSH